MPELPETETIARDLDRELSGRRIVEVSVTRPDVLREVAPAALGTRLNNQVIATTWRRAKLVVIDLSSGDRLVVQPRFTGALLIDRGDLPEHERLFSTLALTLDDGVRLHYRDIRRLGTVALMDPRRWTEYESMLGVEPLASEFTALYLSDTLRSSRQAIKKVLMDQRRIAGIGNIYANESLWLAGIDPSRPARSLLSPEIFALHRAITNVLTASIAARGTSFRDYRDASGNRGAFAAQLGVYGRGGSPCNRCGARLIDTDAVDGRTTVFCARCQR
ncbi:MAG: bifunctional DNA-formamidopyrimidine glycosylase/DNA-(apurinic or apyrimidinic site) lyase [Gemmatimonadota bacterium]|nr:bifunctional DNA-formamidopyrimidine glycosylase/DNA-(apurinic or apyrimidinic site) lyase [Gemmatimonadota bacterium]